MGRLDELAILIGVPESQYGVVAKLRQHAVKLALLHRCFRWASGEFGEQGALGDVDVDDAAAACEATLFFLGRWLIWRPELRAGQSAPEGAPVELAGDTGSDPALRALAVQALAVQSSIRLIERLVRYLMYCGVERCPVAALASTIPFASDTPDELRAAGQWLVAQRQAEWADERQELIRLFPLPQPTSRRRRGGASRAATRT